MLITSKFQTVCKSCQRQILIGDRISWQRGQGSLHAACSIEGQEMAAKLEPSRAASVPDGFQPPVPEGLEYLGYQKAGIAFCLGRESSLIADEMGLGKTIQAIGVINASPDVRNVLVVCPKSLILNWKSEIQTWCTRNHFTVIHGGPYSVLNDTKSQSRLYISIINYDRLKKLASGDHWDLCIVDESHYVKNPKALRTKHLTAITKRCKHKIFLTGTPILNRPIELWPALQMLAPLVFDPAGFTKGKQVGPGEGAGFFRFAKRFCDAKEVYHGYGGAKHWDFTGSSNLAELQEKLRTSIMIRRLKSDVLKDLPAKRRQVVTLEAPCAPNEEAAFKALELSYEDALDELRGKKIKFDELSKARHETALAKVPAAVDFITDALETSQKLIVFAHHHDVIAKIAEGLSEFNPLIITGETPIEERQKAVRAFQDNPDCRLIIGSIGAMGVGLTLTAASHVIFVELSWVPAELTQAEDRAHRIGQLESVLVQHLVSQGSVDARMIKLVLAKQEIADLALDDVTIEDVSGRPVVTVTTPEISDSEREFIHAQLRWMSARCDGAREQDGVGFNGNDSYIGKSLAGQTRISVKQALLGRKILVKYKRQLEGFSK